jgi:hypothetical protein
MKVKAIQRRRWPLSYKGLRSLLGLANSYHHSIQDFSKVARTLPNSLEKKWLSLEWDELCHQAVGELKSKVFSPPVSSSWNLTNILRCIQGRVFCIGGVLMQVGWPFHMRA